MAISRSVESPHYHIWTDALHGRYLARRARDQWDRGTFVRWAIISAWTAFELACEQALGTPDIGYRFKERLDQAISAQQTEPIDWSQGTWQQVRKVHELRKRYVHRAIPQAQLFAPVEEADFAIATLRAAVHDLHRRLDSLAPEWIDDDENPLPPDSSVAHATLIRAGARKDDPETIRITYVFIGTEYVSEYAPPGTDPAPLLYELIQKIVIPISAVRAYKGDNLVEEIRIKMRGG